MKTAASLSIPDKAGEWKFEGWMRGRWSGVKFGHIDASPSPKTPHQAACAASFAWAGVRCVGLRLGRGNGGGYDLD